MHIKATRAILRQSALAIALSAAFSPAAFADFNTVSGAVDGNVGTVTNGAEVTSGDLDDLPSVFRLPTGVVHATCFSIG